MNIVIINDYAQVVGGAAQVAVNSAIALAEAGYNVFFLYGAGDIDPYLARSKVSVVKLGAYDLLSNPSKLGAAVDGIWSVSVNAKLRDFLNNFNATDTVIHLHCWVKALSISAVNAIKKSKIPTVLTLHDYFTCCPNGGLFNYKTKKVCKLKPMGLSCVFTNCDSRSYSQKMWRVARQAAYQVTDFPNCIKNYISVSDFSENLLRKHLPTNANFWRVQNPIDITKASRYQPELSKKYTFIGRISAEKGVHILSRLKSVPQEHIQFIGTGELEAPLKAMMPRATFHGWCDAAKITELLQDTRALLFTSEWYETQGLVVLEAAAHGIPALVSDATAACEFIEEGVTGITYHSGCHESLDKAISTLTDEVVREMSEAAFSRYWQAPPTMAHHLSELLHVYSSVLE